MKSSQLIYLVSCFCLLDGQQYRLVSTCSDEALDANNPIVIKGDKGDRGISGKSGAREIGFKGLKGEIGDCTRFYSKLNARLESKL